MNTEYMFYHGYKIEITEQVINYKTMNICFVYQGKFKFQHSFPSLRAAKRFIKEKVNAAIKNNQNSEG